MIFIVLYLLFFILALLLPVVVFRRLRAHSLIVAAAASLLTLAGFALFFPIPIHGGFTFPLEIAWYQLKREQWHHEAQIRSEKKQAFSDSLQQRFAGTIDHYTVEEKLGNWQQVTIDDAVSAHLDTQSGLLWLALKTVTTHQGELTLNAAYAFCQQQAPQGYWSLPSEAELSLLWSHRGHTLMPGNGQSSIALLSDEMLQQHMPTRYRGRVAGYALRCVALTKNAPRRGYMSNDIPLSEWNNYQLNKTELYAGGTASANAAFNQEIK